jgi:hypothetical protein
VLKPTNNYLQDELKIRKFKDEVIISVIIDNAGNDFRIPISALKKELRI